MLRRALARLGAHERVPPRLGFQVVALEDTDEHPALAFAYRVKLPTADESKGLGTGRFDHKLTGLLSK